MKWNKIAKVLIAILSMVLVGILLGFFLNCILSNGLRFRLDINLIMDRKTYLYACLLYTATLISGLSYYHKHYWLKRSKKIIEGDARDNDVAANLEAARFLKDKEIDTSFPRFEYGELKNQTITGIPVKAEENRGKYFVNLAPNAHTMVIGTTGSGKTTAFISPSIQILSQYATKPSMIIADPKGELYSLHAKSLTEKGYDVKVLDLRNPFHSIRWNPLERPFLLYQRMLCLESEIQTDEEQGTYLFEEKQFFGKEELDTAVQVEKQRLYDEIYEDLNDIVSVLCPITNKNEPIWESGAKNLILAIAIAMLEDSTNPEFEMTKEKFNFYNLTKIATNTEDDCAELIKYFQGRGPLSKAITLSKQVLDSSDKTRGSYLSTMFDKLNLFSDLSLCGLTSANELTFADMAERLIALFLQIPDEKETRHTLASMLVLQAYKELVAEANTYPNLTLPRAIYFLMDEFGNLPPIHKMEQMITVGRSRNIWFCLVIQSYAQLAKVYDEKVAEIIKSNCNIQIFIGTSDQKTIEEFSKRCGNFSVITRNVGYNTVKADDLNSNASVKERPLVYPSELAQLNRPGNMGNAIVTVFGYQPIRSKFTPSYLAEAYVLEKTEDRMKSGRYFDEAAIYYEMKRRNALTVPPKLMSNRMREGMELRMRFAGAIESIKDKIDALLTPELTNSEEHLQLMNFIDRCRFSEAKELLERISIKAENLGLTEITIEIQNVCKKLMPQEGFKYS